MQVTRLGALDLPSFETGFQPVSVCFLLGGQFLGKHRVQAYWQGLCETSNLTVTGEDQTVNVRMATTVEDPFAHTARISVSTTQKRKNVGKAGGDLFGFWWCLSLFAHYKYLRWKKHHVTLTKLANS